MYVTYSNVSSVDLPRGTLNIWYTSDNVYPSEGFTKTSLFVVEVNLNIQGCLLEEMYE